MVQTDFLVQTFNDYPICYILVGFIIAAGVINRLFLHPKRH